MGLATMREASGSYERVRLREEMAWSMYVLSFPGVQDASKVKLEPERFQCHKMLILLLFSFETGSQ